ncbi:chemotaxis protein CheD [Bacillus weihaiensis]|uniref:Chemoreceptor glutamine deamidase CheD n=1 Tax=Bacillus weihaiensis TaxID=1547283 RepID=A0A1L3MSC5_9BACI|nr:chemotaxis protein CheD [Bacillus weihaiensis]APH05235.1 chemotaxis protein CheD [Bacillus weihaiensis]
MTIETPHVVKVGIADFNVVTAPNIIRTAGLGSCVGLILFDKYSKKAGLAHIMLPDSSLAQKGNLNQAKYADTAIPLLLDKLKESGANIHSLKAKMAGGAQMFQFQTASEMMRIGPRNIESVRMVLLRSQIPLISEDVGGSSGRTIEFNPDTCDLMIRTVNQGTKFI